MDPSLVAVLAATLAGLPGGATLADTIAPAPPPAPAGDILVRYRPEVDAAQRTAVRRDADVRREEGLPLPRAEVVEPEEGVSVAGAIADLERSDDVLYAEPDAIRQTAAVPDDRLFDYLWGLDNTGSGRVPGRQDADIDAPEAWDATTGSGDVRVAVIDTGADLGHPDLAANLWTNPAEVPGNGRDDDGNGFVDDMHGADWVGRDGVPDDANGHGTHVAGTVGAQGNDGAGVAGVAWDAALMPLKVLGADGSGSTSDAIRAYAYAARAGARVVNLSLGGPVPVQAERDAIAALPGVVFVAAAGNDGTDNDMLGSYPCNYDLPNVVCVAATDSYDRLASFSNTGATTVDLAAPGVNIASTYLRSTGDDYAYESGTSMATPHVAGAAALLLARAPQADTAALRRALLGGTDRLSGLEGRTVTGGRLNARGALDVLGAPAGDQSAVPDAPAPASEPAPEPSPQPGPAPQSAPSPSLVPAPGSGAGTAPPAASDPAPVADRTAPLLRVRTRPTRSLRDLVRRRAVRTEMRCSEACRVRAVLTLPAADARRLGFGRVTRPVVLARTTATRASAGTFARNLRLSATERRRLGRARSLRLHVRVRAEDPAGNAGNRLVRLSLRR